ncbi:MAG TPA: hypothetical protein DD806_05705, partial [Flavobacterium sp.]|nr:hypothetical protein [Flavobacterium sp.]
MKKFLLLLFVVASYTMNAQSTFYVATTGSNSNSGTSSSPFLTIQKAVDVASNGDTILVSPGTYSSNVSVNKSLNIFATGSYLDTVLESSNLNSPIFTIFEQNFDQNNFINVTIKGFKFRNSNNQNNGTYAMRIERYAFASIQKCWFENLNTAFSTYYGYYTVVNSIFNNVSSIARNDVGFTDNARFPKIINCTIYNSYSIYDSNPNINTKIYNTVIVSDPNKTKDYFIGSRPILDKVIIDDAPNAISGSDFSTVSNVNAIHFNDLATKDFRLKAYSPAIGYGTDMSITEDLSAGSRPVPVATTADAGAFENALGTPVNAPPTINTINNFIKNEDAAPQTFALTGISDGDLFSTQVVTIAATSSNTALIPNPTITYTPGDTTGVLEFSQAADQTGTATITVTVTDDGGTQGGGVNTFSTSFTVTVNPVNDAPVATPQTITASQDTNKVITLAGTDIDTPVSNLTYSVTVLPTSGSLYQTTNGTSLGTKITTVPTTVTNSDGKVIYEPVWNVSGNGTGTFSFKVYDGTLLSSQADVTVNTTAVTYPVITIAANPTSFAENATSTITATLNQTSSRDLVVPLNVSGTTKIDVDYIGTFASKGEESLLETFLNNGSTRYVQLLDGRYVLANGSSLIIYNPITKVQTTRQISTYIDDLKSVENTIYFKGNNSIYSLDLSTSNASENTIITNVTQNTNTRFFDVVGSTVYYYIENYNTNLKKIYSKTGSTAAVEVFNISNNEYIDSFKFDASGSVYLVNSSSIRKFDTNKNLVTTFNINSTTPNSQIRGVKLFDNILYATVVESNIIKIKKYNTTTNTFDELNYDETNTKLILDFTLNPTGNLQLLRQDSNNRELYSYQLSPQFKIPAGATSGTLTLSAIDDISDEENETIILTPGSVTNATLSSNTAVTVTITDNDEMPTVAFALSAPIIVENSSTDVTLTATPSVVSGKEIRIPFTLSGTATLTTEYTVSANEIIIPANAVSGSITISTRDKNDTAVEVMETIKFTMGTIVNASSTTTEVILNLESDDNPTITSIVGAPTTFAENASSTITATIDLPSSKDVIVPIAFTGTAGLDVDYTGTFPSRGEETLVETFLNTGASRYVQLADGRNVIANGNTLIIYNPTTKTQTTRQISNYIEELKAVGNIIYYRNWQSVFSLDIADTASSEVTLVTNLGQDSGVRSIDVVGTTLYYYVENYNTNTRKIFSKTATPSAVATEVFDNGSGNNIESFSFDTTGSFYLSNNWSIRKFDANKQLVATFTPTPAPGSTQNSDVRGIKLFNNELYVRVNEAGVINKVKKYNSKTNTLDELGYANINTKPVVDFLITSKGNLQLLRQDNNNNQIFSYIYNYQLTPELKIAAGSTSGSITLKGIEDDLNYDGQEIDETIILNYTNPINSSFKSGLSTQMELKLLNNSISLTPVTSPFVGLENGAVSWGDYDQDGDQDVAVMGQGISGAVTKVYENKNGVFVDTNQNFTRVYAGDIAWVDINKDGWLDLAVSGSNGVAPLTKIYINDKGTSFASTIDFGLPQLFSSKMAWGDLDNDGDIDLAITGVDSSDKFQFNIYYRDNTQNKFTAESKTINTQSGQFAGNNYRGVIDGDIKIVDLDLDGDNDIVYNGASSDGSPYSNTLINTYIKNSTTNTNSMMSNFSYKNS